MAESAAVAGVDPSRVNTPEELAACLNGLRRRRGLSYEAMDKAAAERRDWPGRSQLEPLGKSTVGEIVTGKRLPTRGKLLTFLAVCGVTPADLAQWLAAWERARTSDLTRPADAVRVRDARPRLLGVHDAIHVEEEVPGELPVYVPRDIDGAVRAELTANAQRGCFVLLIGGSSVGKTRTLYEAVLAGLPDWWLIHPEDAEAIRRLADAPTPRTVVWLDELQRYLGTGASVTAGTVRSLLRAGAVLATTIWPDEYGNRIAPRRPGYGDPHALDRELLDLAKNFDVADAFTRTENDRALELAAVDARLRLALDSTDGGLTQVLAAGPQLMRWWEQAHDPYAKAIITAAVDARRLGAESPMTTQFLSGAVRGYLTPAQRAIAPADWLERALDYATTPMHGAASTLRPVDDGTMSRTEGYVAADYLLQHSRRTRQDQLGPLSLWDALTTDVAIASDLTRLGQAARARGLYRHAAALWTKAVTLGRADAGNHLINHLRHVAPGDIARAALWAVGHINLRDPLAVARLLGELRGAGADDAVRTLLARDPAGHADLDDPAGVYWLLRALRAAGASDAVHTLATRAADCADLDHPAVALLLRELRSGGTIDAVHSLATRGADHASLDNLLVVALLLTAMRKIGADDAVRTLLARDPAAHASLDDPALALLLRTLREAGAKDAVRTLLARDPAAHASLDDPVGVTGLLLALRQAGASDAVRALATRAADHASLHDPGALALLLMALRHAGAGDVVLTVATRAVGHASLDDPLDVAELLRELREAGANDAVHALIACDPVGHASLDNSAGVAWLLRELREAGANDAVHALIARDPVGHASLDDPRGVACLLRELREAGADDAVHALGTRAVGHASLDDPEKIAELLKELRAAGANDAVHALIARDPVGHASLDHPWAVAQLLGTLHETGASDSVTALITRVVGHASLDDSGALAELLRALHVAGADDAVSALAIRGANAGMFDLFLEVHPDEVSSYWFGREPDGTPSQPWKWQSRLVSTTAELLVDLESQPGAILAG